ncbi:hypothetical protein ACO0SA_001279 [Hanseniaspora valbyensis]
MVMNFEQNGIDINTIEYEVPISENDENAFIDTPISNTTAQIMNNKNNLDPFEINAGEKRPLSTGNNNDSNKDFDLNNKNNNSNNKNNHNENNKLRKIQSYSAIDQVQDSHLITQMLQSYQKSLLTNQKTPKWSFNMNETEQTSNNRAHTAKTDISSYTELSALSSTPGLLEELTIGEYLWARMAQIGCHTVFGLPGDFNLRLLDKISKVPGIKWCGNTSELNAAYAADGYSRIKGIGAICTTFGVGELSSINGIAGSFAEHVGVLHIVGAPAVSTQLEKLLVHHTLGNGDFNVFQRMFAELSTFSTMLQDPDLATMEIDKCIVTCILTQKPCYLSIPANMADIMVPRSSLSIPLVLSLPPTASNLQKETSVVDSIVESINKSIKPCIIVDGCCYRHNIMKETNELIKLTNIPVFVTPMGKGAIDEQLEKFGGIYVGTMSSPEVKEYVDSADLVICIGSILNDFATSTFHFAYKSKNVIEFNIDFIKLKSCKFPELQMKPVLNKLINKINHLNKQGAFKFGNNSKVLSKNELRNFIPKPIVAKTLLDKNVSLRQSWIWEEISHWLKPGDIIMAETGTSAFGIMQTRFPDRCMGISQVLWSASGYSLGSALGVMTAARDAELYNESKHYKRCVVFVGDGSFQFTVQEISTMLKNNLKPYIFVMNNNGYTIDRILHKSTANKPTYHDVQPWKIEKILRMFGGRVKGDTQREEGEEASNEPINCENFKVETVGDFEDMLKSKDFSKPDRLRLIEVVLPMMDAPANLLSHVKNTDKN